MDKNQPNTSDKRTLEEMLNKTFASQNYFMEKFQKRMEIGNGIKALQNEEMFLFHFNEFQIDEPLEECIELSNIFSENYKSYSDIIEYRLKYYIHNNKLEEGLKLCDKLLRKDEKKSSVLAFRGEIYFHLKEYEKGLKDSHDAFEMDQKNEHALITIHQILMNLKDYKNALITSAILSEILPKKHIGYELCGDSFFSLHLFDKAEEFYSKSIEFEPLSPILFYKRSIARANNKDYKNAIFDAEKAKSLEPNNPSYINLISQLKQIING